MENKVSIVTAEIQEVRRQLYEEIKKNDRTAVSLMRDGYTRSNVQLGMPVLIKQGLIYKHGAGKNTYYTIHKHVEKTAFSRKLDPIKLPEALRGNFALAFRMGYTDVAPIKGAVHKEVL